MRPDAVQRVLDAELAAARERRGAGPRVLDVGGGSGVWAVPLAAAGCEVTVVEPSPNALATLNTRAREAGVTINAVQGDTDSLGVPAGEADLVLAHGLLEVVDDAPAALASLAVDPEENALLGSLSVRLGQLLRGLPDKQREILLLRVVVGLTAEETAEAIGSTPGAVRVAQHRALAKLRTSVGVEELI